MDHSRVHASHGSFPAVSPRKYDHTRFKEKQSACRLKHHSDRYDQIPDVPAAPGLIGVDSPRHSQYARECA